MLVFEQVFALGKGNPTAAPANVRSSRYRWTSTPAGTGASVGRVVFRGRALRGKMRRYNEQVHVAVSAKPVAGAPARFRWRGVEWQVTEIHEHWVATADWWDSPAARALRGEEIVGDQRVADPDIYDTQETWRVSASAHHTRRVSCDLVQARGRWYLDIVAD